VGTVLVAAVLGLAALVGNPVAAVILILTGVGAGAVIVWDVRQGRHHRSQADRKVVNVTVAGDTPRLPLATFDGPPDGVFVITLDDEDYRPFGRLLVAELLVTIGNLTDREQTHDGFSWEYPRQPGEFDYIDDITVVEVSRELERIRLTRAQFVTTVPARSYQTGWIAYALPQPAVGGIGEFTVRIEDELGRFRYTLHRPAREGWRAKQIRRRKKRITNATPREGRR
jgi:hypothetical protein